jgi:hypothetical protein
MAVGLMLGPEGYRKGWNAYINSAEAGTVDDLPKVWRDPATNPAWRAGFKEAWELHTLTGIIPERI